jgi:hypothetical protein
VSSVILFSGAQAILCTFRLEAGSKPKEEEAEEIDVPKIYYTSRTHTQLRQLTSELMKTTFARRAKPKASSAGPELDIEFEREDEDDLPIRSVPLGGRKQLCINEKVSRTTSKPEYLLMSHPGQRNWSQKRRRAHERSLPGSAEGR